MSNQTSQKVRRNQSPSTMQRPMKAIHTFSLKQGSPTRNNGRKSSQSSSPTPIATSDGHRVKTRRSPDNRSSPERRSPSSPSQFKVERPKPVRLSPSGGIRRTGSLDTIAGPYLTGQWPRDRREVNVSHSVPEQPADKSTQTPEEWEDMNDKKSKKGHKRSASLGNGDQQLKEKIKQHLQRSKEGSKQSAARSQRQSPVPGNHAAIQTAPTTCKAPSQPIMINIQHIPKVPRYRGSVEGLNQEIETLSLAKATSGNDSDDLDRTQEPTPDGHRAPVLELISSSTRDIDTQTPLEESSRNSSSAGSRSQSVSPSMPIIPGTMDTSRPSSRDLDQDRIEKDDLSVQEGSSPDPIMVQKYAASPRPNKSYAFVREPPDGCERAKVIDESHAPVLKEPLLFCPVRSNLVFAPSEGSAFCYLQKNITSADLAIESPASKNTLTSIESQ
ncbi:unnamed protein product [Owenia fusiformis]|uniref:Glucocorticoid-induced transcript 1 protein n=1 Tax=Owenia fusiformis TaxID=6347 RepID=A0A8S4P4D2_OWEFU|nr:unnamed protein product [Owenia fusiformis]